MSILKVNDIRRATTGSSTLVFSDPVTIITGSISASALVGNLPGAVGLADASIGKEKLTNDAREWVNILNKPIGLLSSSDQLPSAVSGTFISPAGLTASAVIFTSGTFSGSGAGLSNIPNSALTNNSITINGVATALGASRTLTTNNISESINLYYTDARVKAKLNTDGVVSSSGQINYQSVTGQPSVNTSGSDGNKSFTVTAGIFVTGSTGIDLTVDAPNAKLTLKTVGGTVSSSAQVQAALPAGTVSSSTQTTSGLPAGTVSSSAQYPGWVTSSTQVVWSSVNYSGGIVSSSAQVSPLLPAGTVSSSAQTKANLPAGTVSASAQINTGSFSGSITSASYVSPSGLPAGTVSASGQVSYTGLTSIPSGIVSASSQVDVRSTTGIATIATTGSNTFNGNQIMSGSVTVTGNLTVQGTSSILYTTSSQLNVGTNVITVGTNQILRFGGLSVIDSGSANKSGSLYWDSVNNRWLYENVTGGSYNSAIIVAGPKNTGALGAESGLVSGRIPVANGDDHIDTNPVSSSIRVDFTSLQTHIENSLYITGSVTASGTISGSLTGAFPYASLTGTPSGIVSSSTASSPSQGTVRVTINGANTDVNTGLQTTSTPTFASVSATGTSSIAAVYSSSGQIVSAIAGQTISPTKITATSISSSVSGALTGTFPYSSLTGIPTDLVSGSTQVKAFLPGGTVSSSGQVRANQTSNFTTDVQQVMSDNVVHSASYLGTATTNNLTEGFTNLYYTDARVKTKLNADNVMSSSYLGTATTSNLTEGSNLYFTNARVITALPANTVSSSNQVTAFLPGGTVSSSTQVNLASGFGTASQALTASFAFKVSGTLATSTDGLPEGTTNLYYTDARVKTKLNGDNVMSGSYLGTATTTNLTEGTNLYFTNARAIAALPNVISSSAQFKTLTDPFTGSFTGSHTGTFPYSGLTGIPSLVSASSQIDYNSIQNKLSGVVSSSNQVAPLLPNGTVSSSAQYPGWVTASSQIDFSSVVNKNGVVSSSTQFKTLTDPFTGSFTGSYKGDGSGLTGIGAASLPAGTVSSSAQYPGWVTSSTQIDYNSIQNKLSGVVSSSTQVQPLLPNGSVSSSAQYPGWVTASSQVDYNSIQNKLGGVVSASTQVATLLPNGTVSASAQYPGWVTASTQVVYTSLQSIPNGIVSSSAQYPGWVTASSQVDYNSIQNKLSGVVSSSTQVAPLLPNGTVSSSTQISLVVDNHAFVGDGVTTNYTLSSSYDPAVLTVSVDGLLQTLTLDYTLSDTTLSFIASPPSASNILTKAFRLRWI